MVNWEKATSSNAGSNKFLKDGTSHTPFTMNIEGLDNAEWVLMDYINVVVHVFQKPIREFYNIEELWGDAETTLVASNY